MLLNKWFISIILCLFFSYAAEAKPPSLSPRDAKSKVEEIFRAHVCYHKFSPELMERTFSNFIDELDPGKTYFLKGEIKDWIEPSTEKIAQGLANFQKEDFRIFEEIHALMLKATERRARLEASLQGTKLPEHVQPEEFKDIKFAHNETELLDRLARIRSLQLEAAEKISQGSKEQFLQRLNKRRVKREEEIAGANAQERQQIMLSYFLKAASSALDSQTNYFTPSEANQFMIQVQQRLFGIGAQLRDDLNGFTIVRLIEGGPALQQGQMKAGDKIIAVNREPVVGMEITEAVELIRGPQGSSVVLTVLRETTNDSGQKKEERLDITIIRNEVVLKETRLETSFEPYGDGVIGVFHLFSFYGDSNTSSTNDLRIAIQKMKEEHNLKGVILDLRNNAGGILPQAVSVAGLFIQKGVVVSIKDNTGQVQNLRNLEDHPVWDGPLIVATNRGSASASEIVAQTLQDYGRALVVGDEETFGKGTFQTFTLEANNFGKVNPKGEYKVTRGRYYTVSGKSPQLVGVKADIVVPGALSKLEIGEKFSKYPLGTESIAPHFEDDLSDVPFIHRYHLQHYYLQELQPILTTYRPAIETLRANSEQRMKANENYQFFLKELDADEFNAENEELFGKEDLQLRETINIMQDLIALLSQQSPPVTAPATTGASEGKKAA